MMRTNVYLTKYEELQSNFFQFMIHDGGIAHKKIGDLNV